MQKVDTGTQRGCPKRRKLNRKLPVYLIYFVSLPHKLDEIVRHVSVKAVIRFCLSLTTLDEGCEARKRFSLPHLLDGCEARKRFS